MIPQEYLLSAAERSFFGVLEQTTFGKGVRIFCKVRLADVVKVPSGMGGSASQVLFNRISSKHVDFVVCDATALKIRACIELDDGTHARRDRVERDAFLAECLESAGVPLLRFKAQRTYDPKKIGEELNQKIEGKRS